MPDHARRVGEEDVLLGVNAVSVNAALVASDHVAGGSEVIVTRFVDQTVRVATILSFIFADR